MLFRIPIKIVGRRRGNCKSEMAKRRCRVAAVHGWLIGSLSAVCFHAGDVAFACEMLHKTTKLSDLQQVTREATSLRAFVQLVNQNHGVHLVLPSVQYDASAYTPSDDRPLFQIGSCIAIVLYHLHLMELSVEDIWILSGSGYGKVCAHHIRYRVEFMIHFFFSVLPSLLNLFAGDELGTWMRSLTPCYDNFLIDAADLDRRLKFLEEHPTLPPDIVLPSKELHNGYLFGYLRSFANQVHAIRMCIHLLPVVAEVSNSPILSVSSEKFSALELQAKGLEAEAIRTKSLMLPQPVISTKLKVQLVAVKLLREPMITFLLSRFLAEMNATASQLDYFADTMMRKTNLQRSMKELGKSAEDVTNSFMQFLEENMQQAKQRQETLENFLRLLDSILT